MTRYPGGRLGVEREEGQRKLQNSGGRRQVLGSRAMKNVLSVASIFLVLAGVTQLHADDAKKSPDDLFKKLDVNGDGKLSASEIPKEQRKFFDRLVRMG